MTVTCKCTDSIPHTEHKSEERFLCYKNQRNQQYQNNDHITTCHSKCRGSRNTDCSADHTATCMINRTYGVIISQCHTWHISFHQKLDQSTQKDTKQQCRKRLFVCQWIPAVRNQKYRTSEDQNRKQIRKDTHHTKKCRADRCTDSTSHSEVTENQNDRSSQNDKQNDLCLKSTGHTLFCCRFLFCIFTSGRRPAGPFSVGLFLCCCHSGTPPKISSFIMQNS